MKGENKGNLKKKHRYKDILTIRKLYKMLVNAFQPFIDRFEFKILFNIIRLNLFVYKIMLVIKHRIITTNFDSNIIRTLLFLLREQRKRIINREILYKYI